MKNLIPDFTYTCIYICTHIYIYDTHKTQTLQVKWHHVIYIGMYVSYNFLNMIIVCLYRKLILFVIYTENVPLKLLSFPKSTSNII